MAPSSVSEADRSGAFYLVHYLIDCTRWDEWVPASRVQEWREPEAAAKPKRQRKLSAKMEELNEQRGESNSSSMNMGGASGGKHAKGQSKFNHASVRSGGGWALICALDCALCELVPLVLLTMPRPACSVCGGLVSGVAAAAIYLCFWGASAVFLIWGVAGTTTPAATHSGV